LKGEEENFFFNALPHRSILKKSISDERLENREETRTAVGGFSSKKKKKV